MKKLIIAAVAVAFAAVAQAASFNWQNTGMSTTGVIYDYTASSTKLASGMIAVLIDSAVTSQSTLLTAARNDGFNLTTYGISGASATVNSSSKISKTADFEYGTVGNEYSFYFAILDAANNQLLISDTATALGQLGATDTASFAGSKTWSNQAFGAADYSAAGWYSTADVPEPTSGLLLLLGMAGLALRRKQS